MIYGYPYVHGHVMRLLFNSLSLRVAIWDGSEPPGSPVFFVCCFAMCVLFFGPETIIIELDDGKKNHRKALYIFDGKNPWVSG